LTRIGALYAIEREIRGQTPAVRREVRRERAAPLLAALQDWLHCQLGRLSGKAPLAGAIQYTLVRWEALTRYCEDGALEIDNNAAERALREIAVGRKNWLFAGSERGGEACAIVTSLIETAKAHGHDPLAYLTDVLERLPTTLNRDIESLLPMNWRTSGV